MRVLAINNEKVLKMVLRIGIDLGGTKTEVIALDGNSGNELFRKRVDTPYDDYQGTVLTIKNLVEETEATIGEKGTVGLGTPGAISPATGLMKNANSTWLIGKPFDKDLEEALARPVKIANDADCLAVSEATDGAGAAYSTVWAVIIGTGSGSGIVTNKHLVTGPNAIAGEWAHNQLPWSNEEEIASVGQCYCGKKGCIEQFISGTGLKKDYFRATGKQLKGSEIVALAESGDEQAEASLSRYEDRLARAMSGVINILDPHVVVLGGGVSNYKRLYTSIPKLWEKYVFSDTVATKLVPAKFGDSSGIRGAAWLWNGQD